ncbi:hypothetical protein IJT93_00455 [bacterium]|nr:hypothetical protein [bacterium]
MNYLRNSAKTLAIVGLCLLSLTAASWAQNFSNKNGTYDGTYSASIKNLTTKEVTNDAKVELEGQYLTIKRKEGDVRYKFSEIFDRRYEKEINIVTPDTNETLVIKLK